MRNFGKLTVVTLVACVAVQLVVGQQPGGIGGIGGVMGKQQYDPALLLTNKDVKKEIKLTKEQEDKLPAAYLEALAKVLEPDQLKRLKQISLQSRDYTAFGDVTIQDELKMTDDQRKEIKTILSDAEKKKADLQAEAKGGKGIGGNQGQIQAITKETTDNIKEVLTAEQRRLYAEMLGDEFKFSAGGIGVGGIGGAGGAGGAGGIGQKKGFDPNNLDPAIQDLFKNLQDPAARKDAINKLMKKGR
ncbi:MAG TPA: hypothetical protein VE988_12010 [Gemmataceae bacterium]|nr:hypothetical protein [Gemmataceae bacterium]